MNSNVNPQSPLTITTRVVLFGLLWGLFVPLSQSKAESSLPGMTRRVPKVIVVRKDASEQEMLAANEIRRYVYQRTGKLMPVKKGSGSGDRIVVSCKNRKFCGDLGQGLAPQQFTLKTVENGNQTIWWIVGGDTTGTLYGAYRFAEKLGVSFSVDDDIIPDEPLSGDWPVLNETGKPRFTLRGLQPFHDFSVGPDWWNLEDYQAVFSQMAKLRLNFLGLHTYPSWNRSAGPEANVWLGLSEDVDATGNVRSGYRAGVVTTRGGWDVKPFPTSQYASGAGLLFEGDDYGPDYMLDCLEWPKTEEASIAMFNKYGDLQQKAFGLARRLGVKTCVGTEMPLGVPKELAARLESKEMKANDPEVIRRLYAGMFLRLMRKIPVDYFWLWTPEIWLREPGCRDWEITTRANVERDLGLAEAAARSVKAPFGFATCGWRLGTGEDGLWVDKRTPKSWAASAIGTTLGRDPVEKYFGTMTGRPKWVIAWAEDDNTAGAHCCTCWDLQLWVERMFVNASDAYRYGCEGMMAIHWRTASIAPNIAALARAGWEYEADGVTLTNMVAAPGRLEGINEFWSDWGRGMFGGNAGAEAGRCIQKLDGSHLKINALIDGGVRTTDESIAELFSSLREMESLRPRIKGVGNLERFDYWYDTIRATQLRVRTWVLASRLGAKVQLARAMVDAGSRREVARREILPLRLELARSYEDMIDAFIRCAKSPGEVGTIASIESGSRNRVLTVHDVAIEELSGAPLPAEAAVKTAYKGAPRIFVSAMRTLMNQRESQEIRVFVLSRARCTSVKLYWRVLGSDKFKTVEATPRARQAYRVNLPAQQKSDTVEYYLEATLDNGQRVLWPTTAPSMNHTVIAW